MLFNFFLNSLILKTCYSVVSLASSPSDLPKNATNSLRLTASISSTLYSTSSSFSSIRISSNSSSSSLNDNVEKSRLAVFVSCRCTIIIHVFLYAICDLNQYDQYCDERYLNYKLKPSHDVNRLQTLNETLGWAYISHIFLKAG